MRSRRAVSEIVASMVVLMIVSVMGVMLYNISLGTMSGQQNNLLSQISFEEQQAQERFEIVGVEKIEGSTRAIKLWLLNYSKNNALKVTVSQVYINNIPTVVATPEIIKNVVTDIIVVLKDSSSDFELGKNYNILVVSERGVRNGYTWNYS